MCERDMKERTLLLCHLGMMQSTTLPPQMALAVAMALQMCLPQDQASRARESPREVGSYWPSPQGSLWRVWPKPMECCSGWGSR